MRWFFLERDNVTHPSDADRTGRSHAASFEFFPFYEGATFAVYKGMYVGDSSRRGDFCVVKTLLDAPAGRGDLDHVTERAWEAQRLADSFNEFLGYRAIWFALPSQATLKHVSDFNGAFRCVAPHDKRLTRGEHVTLEPLIEGTFQVFNSKDGTVPSSSSSSSSFHTQTADFRQGTTPPKSENKNKKRSKKSNNKPNARKSSAGGGIGSSADKSGDYAGHCHGIDSSVVGSNNMAQAFSHYAWLVTGSSIVCDLKGVCRNSRYALTTPVIHSTSSAFGPTDGGPNAIARFFASHRCTNICRQWPVYSSSNGSGSNNGSCNRSKQQINFFGVDAPPPCVTSMANAKNETVKDNKNLFLELCGNSLKKDL